MSTNYIIGFQYEDCEYVMLYYDTNQLISYGIGSDYEVNES